MGERNTAGKNPAESSSEQPLPVLLVEDDEVSRLYLHTLLTGFGYRTVPADSGKQALQLWQEGDYRIILLDIQLPEMNGLEVAAEIRRREREAARPRTILIALTAYASDEDRQRIREADIDRYLSKPAEAKELEQALGEELGIPSPSAPAAESGKDGEQSRQAESAGRHADEYARRLRQAFADSRGTLSQMAEMSLQEIPVLLQAIDRAIETENDEEGAREAHSLANVAGILFAADIRNTALTLEEQLREGAFEEARHSYRQTVTQFAPLMEALQQLQLG
jgi:CheY-like chemotaxis protein